jgi:hypothetical protein
LLDLGELFGGLLVTGAECLSDLLAGGFVVADRPSAQLLPDLRVGCAFPPGVVPAEPAEPERPSVLAGEEVGDRLGCEVGVGEFDGFFARGRGILLLAEVVGVVVGAQLGGGHAERLEDLVERAPLGVAEQEDPPRPVRVVVDAQPVTIPRRPAGGALVATGTAAPAGEPAILQRLDELLVNGEPIPGRAASTTRCLRGFDKRLLPVGGPRPDPRVVDRESGEHLEGGAAMPARVDVHLAVGALVPPD